MSYYEMTYDWPRSSVSNERDILPNLPGEILAETVPQLRWLYLLYYLSWITPPNPLFPMRSDRIGLAVPEYDYDDPAERDGDK